MNKCTVSVNPFPQKLPYQPVCECCFCQLISFHTSLPPFVSSITVVVLPSTTLHMSLPHFMIFFLHQLSHIFTAFASGHWWWCFSPSAFTLLYHLLCQGIDVFCSTIFHTSLPPFVLRHQCFFPSTSLPPFVSGHECFLLHHLPYFSTHLYKSVVPFTGTPAGHQWSDATHTQRTEIVPAKDRKISAKFCETNHIYRPKL